MMATRTQPEHSRDKRRVFVVEDHPIISEGLQILIGREDDLEICGEAGEAEKAMQAIALAKPDVVMVDITLPGRSGLDLIKDIKTRQPELPVVVLSMHDERVYAERALRAGALGYVMKSEPADNVMTAIRKALRGEVYVSDSIASTMVREFVGLKDQATGSAMDRLSDRELEVFTLVGNGIPPRHIAAKLHLSVKTIETYRDHIKKKLGLEDATQLLQHAIQWVQSQQGATVRSR